MAKRRKRKILVPESQEQLDLLKARIAHTDHPDRAKYEVAKDLGIPLNEGYNGRLASADAGKIGGKLGGSMVKELTKLAKENIFRQ